MEWWKWILAAILLLSGGLFGLVACAGSTKQQVEEGLRAMDGGLLAGPELRRVAMRVDLGRGEEELEFLYARLDGQSDEDLVPGLAPIVLVHGTPGTMRCWTRPAQLPGGLLEQLPGRAIYAVELLGHGIAPGAAPTTTFQVAADHLSAGLAALGLEGICLVGHSYGGEVAFRVALDAPQIVGSLVLIDSSGIARRPDEFLPEEVKMREWSIARWGYAANSEGRIGGAYVPHFSGPPPAALVREAYLSCDNPANWKAMVDLCRDENGTRAGDLPQLAQPTLLVWGENDLAYPPDRFGAEFERLLPDGRLTVLPGVGHYPQEEAPAALAEALGGFLGSLEAVPGASGD